MNATRTIDGLDSLPPAQRALFGELNGLVEHDELAIEPLEGEIPTGRYVDPAVFALERDTIFRRLPLVIAHADEVCEPGQFVTHDLTGMPLIVVRGRDQTVRAFKNTCMHRGTRLCDAKDGRTAAFVCPYHAWTYGLDGTLKNVPHQERAFPTLKLADHALVEVPCVERHGFIWVAPGGEDSDTEAVKRHLGSLDQDLEYFDLANHTLHRSATMVRNANWKLLIEAFLEGYHVTILHRRSVGGFFYDARSLSRWDGQHLRGLTARKRLGAPEEGDAFRDVVTPSVLLFPNTKLIFHPGWVSRISVFPLAADRLQFVHSALVPRGEKDDAWRETFERSWALIHERVFCKEDIGVCESIQRGLQSGALPQARVGGLDAALLRFGELVTEATA